VVEVNLWGSLAASTGGADKLNIEAKDIRELLRKLAEQYPGVEPYLAQGIAVSINGVIYRDNWTKELPQDAEIFLLPRLAGG
jgi:molybdopterin synthase sulfur carrier subunit